MTAAESASAAATAGALEREYRRIVHRWYPAAWTAVNGEALVGMLLDAAEHRGASSVTGRTRVNLARHGVALRAVDALPRDVRAATASISAGAVTAYSVILVLTGSRTPGNRVPADGGAPPLLELPHLLALTPFLVAWLLVAACAFLPRRRTSLAVLSVLAVVVTVVCSPLWFLDALVNPSASGWGSWWGSIAYAFPGSVSNLVFLLGAGCAGFLGRARVRPFLAAVLGTGVIVVGMLLLRIGTLSLSWPDWIWAPHRYPAEGVMSIPVLAAAAVTALLLTRTRLRRWALILALSTVPALLGWVTELVLHPVVYVAY